MALDLADHHLEDLDLDLDLVEDHHLEDLDLDLDLVEDHHLEDLVLDQDHVENLGHVLKNVVTKNAIKNVIKKSKTKILQLLNQINKMKNNK